MKTEGVGEWYQSIGFEKLSCRQVSFSNTKGTQSREEHTTLASVITTFTGAMTYWCRKIRQNVSPQVHSEYFAHSVDVPSPSCHTVGHFVFLKYIALLYWTNDSIVFPRHTLPTVQCLHRSCTYGDTMKELYLKADLLSYRNCDYAIGYNR